MELFSGPNLHRFLRFYAIPVFFLVSLLALTFLLFALSYQNTQQRNQNLFDIRASIASRAIDKRLNDYVQILRGAKEYFTLADTVTLADWKAYYQGLNIETNYPGLLGMGFARVVKQEELSQLEKQMHQAGYPEFQVWPKHERPIYSAIVFLEPFDVRNQRAFGYDMQTEPTRAEAMQKALQLNRPAMSGIVTLVQEGSADVQKGFLIYLPVHKQTGAGQDTSKQFIGYVYSPFRVNDLIEGTLQNRFPDLDIEIYDGPKPSEESLLYDSDELPIYNKDFEKAPLFYQELLSISGRHWLVSINALPDFGYDQDFPFWLMGGGMLISGLVFVLMLSVARQRETSYLKQLITDNATAAIFILDRKGLCTFMNPAAEHLTGYKLSEFKDKTFHQLLHFQYPDGKTFPESECLIHQAVKKQGNLSFHEDFIIHKSGQYLPVSINAQPVFSGISGSGYLLEVQDITHLIRSKEDLQRQNRKLEILNSIGQNLSAELNLQKLLQMITDAATHISGAQFGAFFYNSAAENDKKLMLYSISGAEENPFRQFLMPHMSRVLHPLFLNARKIVRSADIRQDERFKQVVLQAEPNDDHLPLRSYLAVPVVLHNEKVIGSLLLGHAEVSMFNEELEEQVQGIAAQAAIAIENSRLFETIRKKNAALIRTNTDLDNFVYSASHDLKAPMLNIEGLITALHKAIQTGKNERITPIIAMMESSVLKFKNTIQALTEVSHINKNLGLETQQLHIGQILNEVLHALQDSIEAQQAVITADIHCPPIYFSPAYLRSILQNLISNAIKYRHPERTPEILVSCKACDEHIKLQISDNGVGIPGNQQDKIFHLFKRYHSHVEGTGVGLYLVKRILENNGGSIALSSTEGKGSTFTLTLPIKPSQPEE